MEGKEVVPFDISDTDILATSDEVEVKSITAPIEDDLGRLMQLAETAEKRVEAMRKLRLASVKATSPSDWVDQSGSPYLQCSGAEKIARLWGLSWKITTLHKEQRDGRYIWFVGLRIWGPGLGAIEVIGTRKSDDPFFAKRGGEIIPDQVDEASVQKAAYTNALVNGITRLLGLRNLTWEELQQYGFDPAKAPRVERLKKPEITDEERHKQNEIRNTLIGLCGGDPRAALLKLKELTTFTAKDGTEVPGVTSFSSLRGKRLDIALGKVRKLKAEAEAAMEQEAEETDTEQPEDGEPVSDTLIEG